VRVFKRRESGQALVLISLSLVVLVGFGALAIDVGLLYYTKQRMQTAADAAAVAAAQSLDTGGSYSTATQAASDVAKLDGFDTTAGTGVTVTAAEPTTSPYNSTGYVQVTVAQPQPTYFLSALGYTSINVSAHAIGGIENANGCIYALDPSRSSTIGVSGNVTITSSCGILDNSSSSRALTASGNITITTSMIGIVGSSPGYSTSGNISITPTPKTKIAPSADPLGSIPAPNVGSYSLASVTSSGSYSVTGNNQVVTVLPGVYSTGISITGNNAQVTFKGGTYGNNINIGGNTSQATFNPGQYQNTGNGDSIDISGNATTTFNSGAYTFYGAVKISGNNTITLQPGLYLGGINVTGNANITFESGTYVLAGGGLSVTGNSTLTGSGVTFYNTSGAVAYAPIKFTGNETANLSAPTSGSLEGMLFFQDRSITYSSSNGSEIEGNSSSTFDGALYFPTTALSYVGNSSNSGYTLLIADTLTIVGNSTIGNNYSLLSNGSPIQSATIYD